MSEARSGSAMRTYQILLVLAFGWLLGRMPELLADEQAERASLHGAAATDGPVAGQLTPGSPSPIPMAPLETGPTKADLMQMAAEIAVRASNETMAQLLAAGWGPGKASGAAHSRPTETVVRIVAPQVPPAEPSHRWELKPGDPEFANLAPAPSGKRATVLADLPARAKETKLAVESATSRADEAYGLAEAGYQALRKGERAEAAGKLAAAIAADPAAPNAANWQADLKALTRHWAVSFYSVARDGGGDPLAASPVLGGGQTGAMLAYRFNPLGDVPVSAFARVTAATGVRGGIDRETVESAVGLRVEPLKSLPVAVDLERRFAHGTMSRNAWSARVSGGGTTDFRLLDRVVTADGWAEAGIVGFRKRPDYYAGIQMRAGSDIARLGRTSINLGVGNWIAVQRGWGVTASRIDLGPSARFRVSPWRAYAQVDYRARLAGNARPASGPVVTVGASF